MARQSIRLRPGALRQEMATRGLTYEQLADALGLPLGTVRSRLSRVRAKLRARLAPTEVAVEANGSPLA